MCKELKKTMRKISHEIKNFNKEVESIKEQNRNSGGKKDNKYNKSFTKQLSCRKKNQ